VLRADAANPVEKVRRRSFEAALNHVSGHKDGVAGIYNLSTYAA
jgi:hypothetical protein